MIVAAAVLTILLVRRRRSMSKSVVDAELLNPDMMRGISHRQLLLRTLLVKTEGNNVYDEHPARGGAGGALLPATAGLSIDGREIRKLQRIGAGRPTSFSTGTYMCTSTRALR